APARGPGRCRAGRTRSGRAPGPPAGWWTRWSRSGARPAAAAQRRAAAGSGRSWDEGTGCRARPSFHGDDGSIDTEPMGTVVGFVSSVTETFTDAGDRARPSRRWGTA